MKPTKTKEGMAGDAKTNVRGVEALGIFTG
jgi:hypothetical protein